MSATGVARLSASLLLVCLGGSGCLDQQLSASADVSSPCAQSASAPPTTTTVTPVAGCHVAVAPSPVEAPWAVRTKWSYGPPDSSVHGSVVAPMAAYLADDNGDGHLGTGDRIAVLATFYDGTLVALDGPSGAVLWSYSEVWFAGGVAIGDIDRDGWTDIVTIGDHEVVALNGDGTVKWRTEGCGDCVSPTIADLDGDGQPEILTSDPLLRGEDGSVITELGAPAFFGGITAADLDLDGTPELLVNGSVYGPDGSLEWSLSEPRGPFLFPVVLQADDSATAEVAWVGGGENSLWSHDGAHLLDFPVPGNGVGGACLGDFDGDAASDIVIPSGEALSMFRLDGTLIWSVATTDRSGLAGCSGFDLDADGAMEVLYADEVSFQILDGRTGSTLYIDTTRASGTLDEYPVVADVDGDGHAEILLANQTGAPALQVLEHDGAGWAPGGPGWNLPDFAVTNASATGRIPRRPEPSWLSYNMWRARPAADAEPLADLSVRVEALCDPTSDQGARAIIEVVNQGVAAVPAGVSVVIRDGAQAVATLTLPMLEAATRTSGLSVDLPQEALHASLSAEVDPAGHVPECDETNNQSAAGE